jgi:hypothetical protein
LATPMLPDVTKGRCIPRSGLSFWLFFRYIA